MNTLLFSAASILLAATVSGFAQSTGGTLSPHVLKDLAPTGKLRAAINLGNSVLAQRDETTGEPKGITPDLARELARRLGVPVELITFDAAGKVFEPRVARGISPSSRSSRCAPVISNSALPM